MLDKKDIQIIAALIDGGSKSLREELSKELKAENATLSKELKVENAALRKELKAENATLRKELKKEFKSGITKVLKKLNFAINFLDRDHLGLVKRVNRIETHLKLPPLSS